ncbi:MAG TPA: AMP-binding protein [Wenzhouxiangellaceae bacterium]|nr:AMP-binding protein [Wenzhouxiangellaceae bacterium]
MTAWLAGAAQRQPEALALVQGSKRLDYAELAGLASRRAAMLYDRGLRTDDRVVLEAPVTLASAVWVHALLWLGATVVPVAPSLPPNDCAALLRRLAPRALITSNSSPAAAQGGSRGLIVIDAEKAIEPGTAPLNPAAHDPARMATILMTSGSSSTPKAVPLTLGNHAASAAAVAQRLGTATTDRWLLCLPLEHIGGLAILFRCVLAGTAAVLMPRFDAAGVNDQLKKQRITLTSLVPSMLDAVVQNGNGLPPPGLRGVFIGGAPAAPELLENARSAGWPVLPTWGMTEAGSQLATPAPATVAALEFSAQSPVALPPLSGVEVRTASSGALQVRGPMLFSGYLDDAASGPDAEGWFTTGDRGTVEANGSVRIAGRIDNVIISGGINVSLDSVARRLLDCPLIEDAATVGVEDRRWGQRVAAAVVVADAESPNARADAFDDWSRRHLPPAERPARWRFVDRIPRGSSGKPLGPAVRALFE